ncbi:bifunctional methylenetetrahydrofolate dehydrogenase/methenyltetrahydrofolate cyclohydrolase FolD [Thalassomonas sp. M1454]|uniref:bifunctional methylenetetrahydrofolate dehydrogenase/methenyltetrahydrofolate cyclohydrolase FolD n=1 Tax=Thalassomonas sp. M1454 TaxID=2594477 RepID=UPI00117BE4A7|nr:bifunctional methylenetetrahydrofolate dehydrogenase/methenyltetrahydrofolate cyclohydrolase FolD [Thalassomonas sp. M1454]TRX54004.1 bifunctional methylenetetrahydrofolate dehydrogenase/methenyltetrahydrofolate cyclohydrolase FolD [Thalassomonas sp. M1454]
MIIDGKIVAQELRSKLKLQVQELKAKHNITPGLTVVLVGDDPASHVYVRNKIKQTTEVGMISNEIRLAEKTTEEELIELLHGLNNDDDVHGILVQLPLPKHINEQAIITSIIPEKDVDGFHAMNSGHLLNGDAEALVPCTPQGCVILAKKHLGNDLSGKHAVIVGRSNIVGKPVSLLFLQENCTVTVAHSRSTDLPALCRQADILVAAVGRPLMIKADWVKPGATVIDVGINHIEDEQGKDKLVGDVDFAEVSKVASGITPVPGGVGPMTIACLLKNTLRAAKQHL